MNSLTPVFELYVAINGAYIISQKFTEFLNERVMRSFHNAKVELSNLKAVLLENETALQHHLVVFNNRTRVKDQIMKLDNERSELETDWNNSINETELEIEKRGGSSAFSFYCLFAAIFSFIILLLVGFDIYEMVVEKCPCVTIFSALFVLLFFGLIRERDNLRKRYHDKKLHKFFMGTEYLLCFWVSGLIAASVLFHIVGHFFPQYSFTCCWSVDSKAFNYSIRAFFVIVPMAHFIYYFRCAVRNKNKFSVELIRKTKKEIEKAQAFSQKISTTVDVANNLTTTSRPKRS